MASAMTKFTPIESEFGDEAEQAAYDAWFRVKVERAIADPRPRVPHEQVMAQVRAIIERHRNAAD